jgi:GH15 family glucan-1,4-alpha-glucosidase
VPYLPIEDYGIIGNMRTAALVGRNGSIDWFCYPRFDSGSVFGAILDDAHGGRFRIAPKNGDLQSKQFYWPDTNVLVTRFFSDQGVGQVTDFMPVAREGEPGHQWLVRRVSVTRGSLNFRLECRPAFDYARAGHEVDVDKSGARFRSAAAQLDLSGPCTLRRREGSVTADFRLDEGQVSSFVLRPAAGDGRAAPFDEKEADRLFHDTVDYWRAWLARCSYQGRWREMVYRSALVLKLLTYEPTGAILAAATCSLPEKLGGVRNWDYRYTWIRDAAFTLYALMRIGFTEEAEAFMGWIDERCHELGDGGTLQVLYAIDGGHDPGEIVLDHLEGYRGSGPVRVGNAAYKQFQLDIYGELMDSIYLFNKYGTPISYELWTHIHRIVDWVCENWKQTDEGIWEVRGGRRHFVYSKLMCWVAVDRALRLADRRSFPAPRERWLAVRDELYHDIMELGWSAERETFVQSYGTESLDAASLMMPLVLFVSPTDPRILSTMDAIWRSPRNGGLVSDSLVYRYDVTRTPDGLPGDEGTFNVCTFWLVEALVRASGRSGGERLRDARIVFEQMLGHANHLGLYAEETGPRGEALGNFPQAFTHLGLISAAFNLNRTLDAARDQV